MLACQPCQDQYPIRFEPPEYFGTIHILDNFWPIGLLWTELIEKLNPDRHDVYR